MMKGPFTVVDADSRQPLRKNRYEQPMAALMAGYRYAQDKPDRDFVVMDALMRPVPASVIRAVCGAAR